MSMYVSGHGRLTRDAEIIDTNDGGHIIKFCMATDRFFKRKGEEERGTDFLDVACYINSEDRAGQIDRRVPQLTKGLLVSIFNGELQIDKWQDKDGNNRSRPQIWIRSTWDVKSDPKAVKVREDGEGSDSPPF